MGWTGLMDPEVDNGFGTWAAGIAAYLRGSSQNPQFSEVLTFRQDWIGRRPWITLECVGPERDSLKSKAWKTNHLFRSIHRIQMEINKMCFVGWQMINVWVITSCCHRNATEYLQFWSRIHLNIISQILLFKTFTNYFHSRQLKTFTFNCFISKLKWTPQVKMILRLVGITNIIIFRSVFMH